MAISGTLFIITLLIIAIWVIIELKRFRHKLLAMFLIGLILFSYLSMALIFRGQEIDIKTVSGMITAGRIYFSWLGSVFTNLKTVTSRAIDMDWVGNKTVEDIEEKPLFNFEK